MKDNREITKENFDNLLDCLAADREQAGVIYEEIRRALTRYFYFRGCSDPETLADTTINRVAGKLAVQTLRKDTNINAYFYGFAKKIYLEYVTRRAKHEQQSNENMGFENESYVQRDAPEDKKFECLESCLAKLSKPESELIIQYYSKEKSEKLELRKKIAGDLNLSITALHTRAHRIKNMLRKCVEKCIGEKDL